MTKQSTWLTFAEGIRVQRAGLDATVRSTTDWLNSGAADVFRGKSLLFTGIGASYAAVATPTYVLRQAGIVAYRSSCSDVPDQGVDLADLYVGVSQSGRSRETLQALLTVPKERRVAVVNRAASPLEDQSGHVLSIGDLDDSSMSSIGFTGTVAAIGMLSDWLTTGTPDSGWASIGQLAEEVVADADETLREFASSIARAGTVDIVAAAEDLTAAEQGSLLFREGPLLPAMAMDTRSYLHGPMDCAGPTSHVIFGREREGLLADQLAEKNVPILLVVDADVTATTASIIRIPTVPPSQRVILEVALLQRLVQHVADALDRDIEARAFTRYDTKVDSVQQVIDGTL